jgi:hypothetical protein
MEKNYLKPILLRVILLVLFLAGLVIRVYDLEAFQIGDRQFRSATIARAYYYKSAEEFPEWRRQVAEISLQRAGILEPPITEVLVSSVYRLTGRVQLWISRFLISVFWVTGGIFLYKIVKRILSTGAGLFAVVYYLFTPMGVYISTGFVPDPLMIMIYLLSIFMIIQYFDYPSVSQVIVTAVVSAFAILVKPFCWPALVGVFISLAIYKNGDWRGAIDPRTLTFLVITQLPAIYYVYGIMTGELLSRQAQTSFLLDLLFTQSFWWNWALTASKVVGFTSLIVALISLPMMSNGISRVLLTGLWIGYAVIGLAFPYHIQFGPHYHSQLIIIAAISIGFFLTLITNHLKQLSDNWYWRLPLLVAIGLMALYNLRGIRAVLLAEDRFQGEEMIAQEIGEIVHHSTKNVFLAPSYGTRLEYYGELSGSYWPRNVSDRDRALGIKRTLSVEDRINMLDFSPENFIITDFQEYDTHHIDLKEYLEENCSLVIESDKYLIYNNCRK